MEGEEDGLAAAVNYIVKVAEGLEKKLGYDGSKLVTKQGDGYKYVTARFSSSSE